MISSKKLFKMSRNWQKIAPTGSKRISSLRTDGGLDAGSCNASFVADKGHFVIYTTDLRRFEMPLTYLNNTIFIELFKKSEEEFGLSNDGPITLPCDSGFMEFVVVLIQQGVVKHQEKFLLNSIGTSGCSLSSFHQGHTSQQLLHCGY